MMINSKGVNGMNRIATPEGTKAILNQYPFIFQKKFGQNFLTDKNLLNAIVQDAGLTKDDDVLEIGAGAGALTQILSQNAKSVVSYEIDTDLKETLLSLNLSIAI